MPQRVICFDIGNKRIGVAVSAPSGDFALPCETYCRTKFFDDLPKLAQLAEQKGAQLIVCGLPVNDDGSDSEQTKLTRSFVDELKKHTSLQIVFEDERYTTAAAREDMLFTGVKRSKKKAAVDNLAAAYILDSYLKRKNKG